MLQNYADFQPAPSFSIHHDYYSTAYQPHQHFLTKNLTLYPLHILTGLSASDKYLILSPLHVFQLP